MLVAALGLGSLVTGVALAQNTPDQGQVPGVPGIIMPSPLPQPTISGTPLPYPAYGTPAPDVAQLKAKKGVPQSISLVDSIRIAVALSPTFALMKHLPDECQQRDTWQHVALCVASAALQQR